jgi:hypothetical protein
MKSVRAADEADTAFREAPAESAARDTLRQRAREARVAARSAVSEYYTARAEYLRLANDTDTQRRTADAAAAHLLDVQNEIPPNPARIDKAKEDANYAMQSLAEAEIKLEHARSAVEKYWATTPRAPANPNVVRPDEGRDRYAPPAPAVPDRGYERTPTTRTPYYDGSTATSSSSSSSNRMVYRNEISTYELFDSYGTAMIWHHGQPRLVLLEFDHASGPFWFYRPLTPDACCSQFAFARSAECGGDCSCQICKFAVWHKDNGVWKWEWTDGSVASASCSPAGGVIRSAPAPEQIPQPVLFKPLVADDRAGLRTW